MTKIFLQGAVLLFLTDLDFLELKKDFLSTLYSIKHQVIANYQYMQKNKNKNLLIKRINSKSFIWYLDMQSLTKLHEIMLYILHFLIVHIYIKNICNCY